VAYGQTLTFLFTDVEGSTRRWAADPERMSKELATHDEVLRTVVAEHGGQLFKHTGDGICAVFGSAVEAVRAALAAQERLSLPVRMGLHTGEAEQRDGDWYGTSLAVVARIMDAGHGGQILCSAATAALLPQDVERRPLGDFRMKGLDREHAIVQVGAGHFPPLRAGPTIVDLPERRASLLGRDDLLARIDAALERHRLVTLVGPGGIGKTSAAIEAARRRTGLVQQIAFADLAAVDDADGVVAAVARALGVTAPRLAAIELALGVSDVLIVVDNCEHVIDAAAEVIEVLLRRRARVLATSREHLELDGEVVVPVPPLSDDAIAVALFVDRATAAGAPRPPVEEASNIAQLCRRLDGLPMAIELAASRLNVLSVAQLLDHLGERLELLSAGRRRGRDRHRTLRDTIAWSYDLLTPDEQDLYRRLSVFTDWFDLDDAAAVAGGRRPMDVLDGLGALAAKSLLDVSASPTKALYRFLESIRDHAWGELVAHQEGDELMAVLADHLAARLDSLGRAMWEGPDDDPFGRMGGLVSLQQHALEWALRSADIGRAKALLLPFAAALPTSHPGGFTGATRLADVVESTGGRDPEVMAMTLVETMFLRDFTSYRETMSEILSVVDLASASQQLVSMLIWLTGVAGDEALQRHVLDAASGMQGPFGTYVASAGAFAVPSEESLARTIGLIDEMPTVAGRGVVCASAAFLAQALGRPDVAAEMADRALADNPEPTSAWISAWSHKASYSLALGDLADAIVCAQHIERTARRLGEHSAFVPVLAIHALTLWKLEWPRECARVRGVAPRRWSLFFVRERDEMDAWLAEQLTRPELDALAAEGRAMALDDLLSIAPSAVADGRD
jgi:predicted ATPase